MWKESLEDSLEATFFVNQIMPEIQKEILDDAGNAMKRTIELLIEDIPDAGIVQYRDVKGKESPRFDIQLLKQQLRSKWL